MKIVDKILDPYSIVIDSENFTVGVEKEYEKKDGEKYTVQQNQTFHSTIESALKKIIKYKIADDESVVDLEGAAKKFRLLAEEISDKFGILEKLPKENKEDADL